MKKTKLMLGDNMVSLKKLPDNSVDSVVTDPPYGLSFMGKKWDYDVPSVDFWLEVFRVLKPGGHVLSFGGTRTYHRMVVNIEDAGFEIRDQVMWLYGSGFPKSHNIGKAVDKLEGNERVEIKGTSQYEGWGTALKPANEPICVARKPLSEKSVALNVMKWCTGGINIDGCRIGFDMTDTNPATNPLYRQQNDYKMPEKGVESEGAVAFTSSKNDVNSEGRFPANLILECICDEVIRGESNFKKRPKLNDHNEESIFGIGGVGIENYDYNDKGDTHTNPLCPCAMLDSQSGVSKSNCKSGVVEGKESGVMYYNYDGETKPATGHKQKIMVGDYSDKGGASRFFYQAKVSKTERNLGLDLFEEKKKDFETTTRTNKETADKFGCERKGVAKNTHPTLKPINLMTYLCRLITPAGGIVLDPFMGSGSTGISALLEGFRFVGMEMDEDYFKIAEARISAYEEYRKLLK